MDIIINKSVALLSEEYYQLILPDNINVKNLLYEIVYSPPYELLIIYLEIKGQNCSRSIAIILDSNGKKVGNFTTPNLLEANDFYTERIKISCPKPIEFSLILQLSK